MMNTDRILRKISEIKGILAPANYSDAGTNNAVNPRAKGFVRSINGIQEKTDESAIEELVRLKKIITRSYLDRIEQIEIEERNNREAIQFAHAELKSLQDSIALLHKKIASRKRLADRLKKDKQKYVNALEEIKDVEL